MFRGRNNGVTYLALLVFVAMVGVGLSAVGSTTSFQSKRVKEEQLLFVGGEFRRALERYYLESAAGAQRYPGSLDELLEDNRFAVPMRHLRRIYADPFSGQTDWELILINDVQIVGVASKAQGVPIRQKGFNPENEGFEDALCYCNWQFKYLPQLDGEEQRQSHTAN